MLALSSHPQILRSFSSRPLAVELLHELEDFDLDPPLRGPTGASSFHGRPVAVHPAASAGCVRFDFLLILASSPQDLPCALDPTRAARPPRLPPRPTTRVTGARCRRPRRCTRRRTRPPDPLARTDHPLRRPASPPLCPATVLPAPVPMPYVRRSGASSARRQSARTRRARRRGARRTSSIRPSPASRPRCARTHPGP